MAEIKKMATRDAYGKALVALGSENPKVVALDADLSCSTKTGNFCKAYPTRFVNAGVAEQDMIGMAAGISTTDKIVFCSTFAIFGSGRVWEQIRDSICYPRMNVKIVVTHAGITTGEDGVTHQAMEDIAIMRAIPNLTVLVPADAVETDLVIRKIANINGPFYVRLSRAETPIVFDSIPCKFEVGKAQTVREGSDLTIAACGIMVATALEAAAQLATEGIQAKILNISTIKPIDSEAIIAAAKQTGAVLTCEEHSIIGGLGSAVAEVLAENYPVPMHRVGGRDLFAESGKAKELLEKYGMDTKSVYLAAKELLERKKGK